MKFSYPLNKPSNYKQTDFKKHNITLYIIFSLIIKKHNKVYLDQNH